MIVSGNFVEKVTGNRNLEVKEQIMKLIKV